MNFRDTLVVCKDCGKRFVFTVEQQRRMAENGQPVAEPDLCSGCAQRVHYAGKLHGTIKWFNPEKGYGFIVQDGGNEVFFHRQGVPLTEEGQLPLLEDGHEVLYDIIETPRGPQAVQVTLYP